LIFYQKDGSSSGSNGRLFHASENLRVLLASYLLQAELGDFDPKRSDLDMISGVPWIHSAGLDEVRFLLFVMGAPRVVDCHSADGYCWI